MRYLNPDRLLSFASRLVKLITDVEVETTTRLSAIDWEKVSYDMEEEVLRKIASGLLIDWDRLYDITGGVDPKAGKAAYLYQYLYRRNQEHLLLERMEALGLL